ncbi:protein of unknown function [Bradyrhizobium vignae]|uniref:Uncharacterized protein n=1 Tax=Bradyrhizobium vignae TaxID=1549949 RepID=A0A2U3Q934_9BRAD|nr:protein of unknown function [Bradyrhizobium vignae]
MQHLCPSPFYGSSPEWEHPRRNGRPVAHGLSKALLDSKHICCAAGAAGARVTPDRENSSYGSRILAKLPDVFGSKAFRST